MIGIDIVEVNRFERLTNDKFFSRVFTQSEREYITSKNNALTTIAGLYACKEAVLKALMCGLDGETTFLDICITHDDKGAPRVTLFGKNQDKLLSLGKEMFVSISHTNQNAIAVAYIIR